MYAIRVVSWFTSSQVKGGVSGPTLAKARLTVEHASAPTRSSFALTILAEGHPADREAKMAPVAAKKTARKTTAKKTTAKKTTGRKATARKTTAKKTTAKKTVRNTTNGGTGNSGPMARRSRSARQ